jgi:hypothetical protein
MTHQGQDRFLLYILIGIAALMALAVGLLATRQAVPAYGPEDTPVGVAQNYATALILNDFDRAFRYVAGPPGVQVEDAANVPAGLPDQAHFRLFFMTEARGQFANTGLQVGDVLYQTADTAVVNVTMVRTSESLFRSASRDAQQMQLQLQNGSWKITLAPYPFWNYAWASPKFPSKIIPSPVNP